MAANGGSLEDCFSNVYALTELNGLKWRCFLTPSNSPRGIPVQSDPILKAYGNCLRDGLICTWRRKPLELKPNEPLPLPSFTNEISKELWLFWYSSEPPEKLSINTSHLVRQPAIISALSHFDSLKGFVGPRVTMTICSWLVVVRIASL
ncbi:hypothetical protein ANCDUO_18516 [Ancylostoma duodenale]|uniref:Mediator of RNA polymerase II transcription subunit 13 n=1 Tax=Ancylostoma duodenale TaxID=51022 RepID=A0A0C2FXQ1_9BILA|nr:hypothetical protein ANCDUO_18516 [Ancylostoma duodenale]